MRGFSSTCECVKTTYTKGHWTVQILQLVALHLLFAALGFCHVSRAAARGPEHMDGDSRAGEEAAFTGAAAAEGPSRGMLATFSDIPVQAWLQLQHPALLKGSSQSMLLSCNFTSMSADPDLTNTAE